MGSVEPTERDDRSITTVGGRLPASLGSAVGPGSVVGRYTLREVLGRGGMGEVFRAHDPRLDREVAIKLLHRTSSAQTIERLRREAMAMARLSHPNVVPIYDVGEHEGSPFLAMELVEGRTLSGWLAEAERSEDEVLAAFGAAGRGLQAAHEAGMTHRDFKPGNVLVGADGRVRVLDFGLARASGQFTREEGSHDGDLLDEALTQAGTVMGTPAYMAPEQHFAEPVGPAADQYAFCLALWEALCGERPFRGGDVTKLAHQKQYGVPAEVPAVLSRRLHSILQRGLSPEPHDRFPTMAALLAVLRPRRRWRLWAALGIAGLGVLGLGTMVAGPSDRAACLARGQLPLEGWAPEDADEVRRALLDTGAVHAEATWARVEPILDEYAKRWAVTWSQTCRAEADLAAVDPRSRCLDTNLRDFRALVRALAHADTTAVSGAVEAARALADPERCVDAKGSSSVPAVPAHEQAEAEALAERLAALDAEHRIGKRAGAAERWRALLAEAEVLDHPPLVIDALIGLAIAVGVDDSEASVPLLTRAYMDALSWGLEERAVRSADRLAHIVGVNLGRYQEGMQWADHMKVAAERLGDESWLARYHLTVGAVHLKASSHREALAEFEDALYRWLAIEGAEGLEVAEARTSVGTVLTYLEDYPRARVELERGVEGLVAGYGEQHPIVADRLISLGHLQQQLGQLDQAEATAERALGLLEAIYGAGHPETVPVLNNLGVIAAARYDYGEASRHMAEVVRILEDDQGPDHPGLVLYLVNLAALEYQEGKLEVSLARLQRARRIIESHYGNEHPRLGSVYSNLGNIYEDRGELERSAQSHLRALAIREKGGPDSLEAADSLQQLANIRSKQDRHDEARELAERALERHTRQLAHDHPEIAESAQRLGYVLHASDDYAGALARWQQAREIYVRAFGEDDPRVLKLDGLVGLALADGGRTEEAIGRLEPALERTLASERLATDLQHVALVRFALARAWWPARPRQAHRYAEQAEQGFRAGSAGDLGDAEAVRDWRNEHPLRGR